MKCLLCGDYTFFHICKNCQELFLAPSIYKRKVLDVDVISFYKYDEIKDFLHTKHTDLGYYIFNILAKNSFFRFAKEFEYNEIIASIAVDDRIKENYSHTAILNSHLKSKYITPKFKKLIATNDISYSGKSKEYRLTHPRNFTCKSFKEGSLILVDDIITTGATLTQAITTLKKYDKEVLFCLTLADARK